MVGYNLGSLFIFFHVLLIVSSVNLQALICSSKSLLPKSNENVILFLLLSNLPILPKDFPFSLKPSNVSQYWLWQIDFLGHMVCPLESFLLRKVSLITKKKNTFHLLWLFSLGICTKSMLDLLCLSYILLSFKSFLVSLKSFIFFYLKMFFFTFYFS